MPNKYFRYSVLLLIVYELTMQFVDPANGSRLKLIISFLFVGSFVSLAIYFFQNYRFHSIVYKPVFLIVLVLLAWGLVNIMRSFQLDFQSLITLFGNKYTGLAMLLPLAIILGSKFENILWYNNLSIQLLKLGFILYPLSLLLGNIDYFLFFQVSFLLLPITLFVYQKRPDKTIIIVSTVFILGAAIIFGGRLSALQLIFVWLSVLFTYLYRKIKQKTLRNISIAALVALPFVIILSGFPLFEYMAADTDTIGLVETTDTRTFLYQEVMEDLSKSSNLFIGKGALGKYYSGYFAQALDGGDSERRLNVEVGVLSMLLKGGIVNLTMNIVLLFFAILLAFKSRNKLTEKLSFLVICHFLSLFIADIPQYSSFSFTMWIAIGCCISLSVRSLPENDIILNFKTKKLNL